MAQNSTGTYYSLCPTCSQMGHTQHWEWCRLILAANEILGRAQRLALSL